MNMNKFCHRLSARSESQLIESWRQSRGKDFRFLLLSPALYFACLYADDKVRLCNETCEDVFLCNSVRCPTHPVLNVGRAVFVR